MSETAKDIQSLRSKLQFDIGRQPDLYTCGPTCLHAVYRYFGVQQTLEHVIKETPRLPNGGTLAVLLACHALKHNFEAKIYTWNLQVFDPTWFKPGAPPIGDCLARQLDEADSLRVRERSKAYLEFLSLGGKVRMEDLTGNLLRRYLKKGIPVLTGLSSTYLYNEPREYGEKSVPDPIKGTPQGHFVVLSGYDTEERTVHISDPLHPNPLAKNEQNYEIDLERVICAIMLGTLTYDANLLILKPKV
jgi:hypothetical protein